MPRSTVQAGRSPSACSPARNRPCHLCEPAWPTLCTTAMVPGSLVASGTCTGRGETKHRHRCSEQSCRVAYRQCAWGCCSSGVQQQGARLAVQARHCHCSNYWINSQFQSHSTPPAARLEQRVVQVGVKLVSQRVEAAHALLGQHLYGRGSKRRPGLSGMVGRVGCQKAWPCGVPRS